MERIEFPNLFSGDIMINRVAFSIFGFNIYWYAILIAIGLVLSVVYCIVRGKKIGLTDDDILDVALFGGIMGFIGARAYYCIFWNLNPENTNKFTLWTAITDIHDGGLAIYGGIIFGVVFGILTAKVKGTPITPLMDVGGPSYLIGQAIGRWGNFINQEAFGAPTAGDLPWGMTGSVISRYPEVIAEQDRLDALGNGGYALVHPCFLYESLWCALGIVIITFVLTKIQTFDGELFIYYFIWYGAGRGVIEGLRTDSLYIGSIRVSQLLGFTFAILGVIILIYIKIKIAKKTDYVRYKDTEACKQRMEAYYFKQKVERETEKAHRAMRKAKKEEAIAPSIFDDKDENE